MITTLAPYNPYATCPKCGCDNVTAIWEPPTCTRPGCTIHAGEQHERLRRTCQRCRWAWSEATLDASPTAPPPPPPPPPNDPEVIQRGRPVARKPKAAS